MNSLRPRHPIGALLVGFLCHSPVLMAVFSPEKAAFSVRVGHEVCAYKVLGVYVLPAETLTLEILGADEDSPFVLDAPRGQSTLSGPRQWAWKAPGESGLVPLQLRNRKTDQTVHLNVFVMVPYNALDGEYLNGYRIGRYPSVPLRGLPIYRPPRGFVEVTPENIDTPVSPHFTLGQFVCKQKGGYPKYVVLRERLLLKLEYLLQVVNERGYRCDSFFIMSGYRTPFYNAAIRNVKYSRHMWGGAADIFIDENPKDGIMDDLNGDGRIDSWDAHALYDLIEGVWSRTAYEIFRGGLGSYGNSADHGPFVHVDARGFRARWGR